MATKTGARTLPDTYFDLVKRFPLTHIRDDRHLKEASAVLNDLLATRLDKGGEAYLDVLTDLVEAYEDEHVVIPDASPADVLRELMATNRLTQPQLAKLVGIAQSTISDVLNGRRRLTVEQMLQLGRHFGIDPGVFLPRDTNR